MTKRLYQCEKCQTLFEQESQAEACEKQPEVRYRFKVNEKVGVFTISAHTVSKDTEKGIHVPTYTINGSRLVFAEDKLIELFGVKK